MNALLSQIKKIGIVPVIKLESVGDAVPLAKALREGGLNCAEVTFRTSAAAEVIAAITAAFPDMLVGAGTVLTTGQADEAIAAGAKFIVTPGLNPDTASYCIDKGVSVTPGVCSPSDIERAIGLGLDAVKFFPAEASGGLEMIKAMAAPYGSMSFLPTGGINSENLNRYLAFPKVIACGGSWMVKEPLIAEGRFDEIAALTREAVSRMLGFELAHLGINHENADSASSSADMLAALFGFEKKTGNSSIFSSSGIELMKSRYLGEHGHIGVRTDSIERAVYHLGLHGVSFRDETAKYDPAGRLVAIYLTQEVGGFSIHLAQR